MSKNINIEKMKQQINKSRCNVNSVRDTIREQFRNKLKEMRYKNLSSIRNITEKIDKIKLLENFDIDTRVLSADEVLALLEEVENEINDSECEQYEQDTNSFIEDMLKDETCPVCGNVLGDFKLNQICDQCSNLLI